MSIAPLARRWPWSLCVGTAILSVLALLRASSVMAQVIENESFRPVFWGPSLTPTDRIQYAAAVTSVGGYANISYLNVVRDDGVWAVQNLTVGFDRGTRVVATTLPANLFDPTHTYETSLSPVSLPAAPPFTGGSLRALTLPVGYQAANPFGVTDYGPLGTPSRPPPPPHVPFPDEWTIHFGVPDLQQGMNQCAPTAAANSLSWLNDQFGLGLGLTTANIRDGLVKDMKTSSDDGTSLSNFFPGKAAFTGLLPIQTHEIAGTFAAMLAELQRGQDVEINIRWIDASGKDRGGHWITLIGLSMDAEVLFVDPDDGGEQVNQAQLVFRDDGTLNITSYPTDNFVALAVAESVVPEPSSVLFTGTGLLVLGVGLRFGRRRPNRD